MGSSRNRYSNRRSKARSVKSLSKSRRRPSHSKPSGTLKTARRRPDQDVPAAIGIEIEEQRGSLQSAVTMLYCLDSALRRAMQDASPLTNRDAQEAVKWTDLTEITEMLLGRLHAIFSALEPYVLGKAAAKWAGIVESVGDTLESLPSAGVKTIDGWPVPSARS